MHIFAIFTIHINRILIVTIGNDTQLLVQMFGSNLIYLDEEKLQRHIT